MVTLCLMTSQLRHFLAWWVKNTVESLNNRHIGSRAFVHCLEVVTISEGAIELYILTAYNIHVKHFYIACLYLTVNFNIAVGVILHCPPVNLYDSYLRSGASP